ncbi:hypothetical protein jhhlp_002386 [Lomentospora prolificans]|uniref:mannan endo-1,4-beta-mannosidase n=1 Tax=Lomentospora prolificans TaxID=41688 RepID=A0A2N3NDY9_9PEZI|nr:hypothetical protein jhhlp_002386 [Lomentospora prolificans]
MKFAVTLSLSALALAAGDLRDIPVTREGTHLYLNGTEWKAVGPNVYWIALDENVVPPDGEPFYEPKKISYPHPDRVTEMMRVVKALGGTMIRAHTLGSNTGSPLSLMPEEGVINEDAWESIDWAIYQARQHGIRLMVPLVDNYDYYHGGKFDFLRWAGHNFTQSRDSTNPAIMAFYEDPAIVASFKSYITTLLTHLNPLTNLTLADDPTIFAIESGNELLGPSWGDMNCPANWVRDIARHVKDLAPSKLFVDGTYGINTTHFDVDEVDIFSDHFYPVDPSKLRSDIAKLEAAGRPLFVGEYGWTPDDNPGAGGDPLPEFFRIIEESDAVIGDTFWSLFGRNMPDCNDWVEHDDGFTMKYGDPTNSDAVNNRIKLIRKHFTYMSQGVDIGVDEGLPTIPCPLSEGVE